MSTSVSGAIALPAESSAAALPGRRRISLVSDVLPPIGVFVLFIAGWYVFRSVVLNDGQRKVLPAPHEILTKGFTQRDNPKNPRSLINAFVITARTSVIGLLISMAIGIVLAVAMNRARWVERSIYPYAVALQTIPILAVVPIMGSIWGYGIVTRLMVCVIISIFPIIINTLFGLKSPDASQHDLFTLQGASRWTRLTKLEMPAAMPAMFEGFRISAGLSVIGAIVGELFFRQGERGLGILIDLYRQRLWGPQIFADLTLCVLLGLIMFVFFGWLRNLVVGKWYQQVR